jgi:ABC-type glycerol-3-phosphate transport system substrate-binding protein
MMSVLLCGAMALGMMALPCSAAEESSELSGELTLLHYLTEDAKLQALDDLIAGFEAENPGVTVNAEAVSMDNYLDVIKLRLSSGDAPDIMFGGPSSYPELVEAGYIMDLTDEEFTSRVSEGSLSLMKLDDTVYGIPLDQMANVVFYNKDIFAELGLEIPTTYSEFIETCQALTDAGYAAVAAGFQDQISIGANYFTMFYGAPYLTCEQYTDETQNEGKSWSEYPAVEQALTQFREVIGYANEDCRTITTDRAEQIFANGESGMIIIGTWGLGAIMNYNPDLNCGGFIYPSEETAEDNALPLNTDDTWMILKDSPNVEIAEAFFEYMTRADVNASWIGTVGQLSALDGVEPDQLPQGAADIADLINEGCNVSMWTEYGAPSGQYSTAYYNTLQDYAISDTMTVAEWCEIMDNEYAAASK